MLSEFFRDLDVVTSDIAVGFMLLSKRQTFTSKNDSPDKKLIFSDWNSLRILYFSALQTVRVVIEGFIAVVIGYCKNVVRILT